MMRALLIHMITVFSAISLMAYVPAHAQSQIQSETGPGQLLTDVSADVLAVVRQNKASYEAMPAVLEGELLAILDPVIDFEAFSRGVMGRYHAEATSEQRAAFVSEFKATLAGLYTSALVAAGVEDITIQDTTSKKPGRANVLMNATTTKNQSYLLQYNMRQSENGEWRIRNIILDGVNIGLTYRNQFKSAMESEGEDIGRVITLWPQIIEGQ